MKIAFDPVKDAINRDKHGCSLALAAEMTWDDALIFEDIRFEYGERRFIAIGYIGRRLYVAVFTDRDGVRRIIGLRKANPREDRTYAQAQT